MVEAVVKNCGEVFSGNLANRAVLVMGLGMFGGGVGVCRFLVEQGAKVTVTDLADEESLAESLAKLEDLPITYHLGGHLEEDFTLEHTDLLIVNPAVRKDSRYLKIARDSNVAITSEMNMFFERCRAPIVAITGSNGKSTTTAMTELVLQAGAKGRAGRKYERVWTGGNIGWENLLCKVDQIEACDVVVLELSSFQLYDLGTIKRSPQVALLTNITANHLDWHSTMEAYIQVKQNILRYQRRDDWAVLNRQDEVIKDWARLTKGKVIWYPAEGIKDLALQVAGAHNQMNAAGALAVAQVFGIDGRAAQEALEKFEGLPHRLELTGQVAGVCYYNDSVATTPQSVIAATEAIEQDKVIILGGYDKKVSFASMVEKIVNNETVKAVVLMGQVADKLSGDFAECKRRLKVDRPICEKADDLAEAVRWARRHAQAGMAVLLSPGCASYDMFRNFQERGGEFGRLVKFDASVKSSARPRY